MGAISSIGMNVTSNLKSLKELKSGVGYPEFLHTLHKNDLPVCEIKESNENLAKLSGMKPELPRTTYLSAIAAMEAMQDAEKNGLSFEQFKIGFISGNTVGGMDTSEFFYTDFLNDPKSGHLREVIHHECGSITQLVADHLKINGIVTTISTACSSSANTMIHAARLIKHGHIDIAIAGGADALCRFTLNGFNTLMILDPEPSKPFDQNRKGLNLGEGAGYLVLVSDKIKQQFNLTVYGHLAGYANTNDAFHQTASSAEGHGNFLAMQKALNMSGLNTSEIDYINAHGTGTGNNDSSEGMAIQRLFEKNIPKISSTKAYTGHTLGACGGLEAVYSCLAIKHSIIFPTLRYQDRIEGLNFDVVKDLEENIPIQHVMSNSFGFGGNCSSLIISKG